MNLSKIINFRCRVIIQKNNLENSVRDEYDIYIEADSDCEWSRQLSVVATGNYWGGLTDPSDKIYDAQDDICTGQVQYSPLSASQITPFPLQAHATLLAPANYAEFERPYSHSDDPTEITFSWTAVPGATRYLLCTYGYAYLDQSVNNIVEVYGTTSATLPFYTYSNLGDYLAHWFVVAGDDTGWGLPSEVRHITMVETSSSSAQDKNFYQMIKGGGEVFDTSDFEGNWYFQGVSFDGNSWTNWSYGTITMDLSGSITGGTYTTSEGDSGTFAGGTFSLSSEGVMTGTFLVSDGIDSYTFSVPDGKMDASKTKGVFVSYMNNGNDKIFIYITKDGGTFNANDLAGTWSFYGVSFENDDSWLAWNYGTIIMDSFGNVTGGSVSNSEGGYGTLTGGTCSLSSGGVSTGSLSVLYEGTLYQIDIIDGKMDTSKTSALMVMHNRTAQQYQLFYLIKSGGTFSTADLAGTWYTYGIEFDDTHDRAWWSYGKVNIDASGNLTGGGYTNSTGSTGEMPSGSLSISSDGVMDSHNSELDIHSGKMDQNKSIFAFVGSATTSDNTNDEEPDDDEETNNNGGGGGGGCFINSIFN